MALNLANSPQINVYRNNMNFMFPDKSTLLSEFDVDNNDFYLEIEVTKLNDASVLTYKGGITTGIPTKRSEGLNQIDLSINLPNGVYKINRIEINILGSTQTLGEFTLIYNVIWNVPSINENHISNFLELQ